MNRLSHLILSPLYPPRRFGGIEKIVERIGTGLLATGDELAVITFDPRDTDDLEPSKMGSVPVWRVTSSGHHVSGLLSRLLASQECMVESALLAAKSFVNRPVIHAHDWFVAPAAIELRSKLACPLLTVFHSDKRTEYGEVLRGDRQRIHEQQRNLAHNSDAILCYSKYMQSCLSKSLSIAHERVGLFPCGLDEDVVPRSPRIPDSAPILLYLGRLAPEKSVESLVAAFRHVGERFPDCKLHIVGDGSEGANLRRQVEAYGLVDRVVFAPFTEDPHRVNQALLDADVLILPSIFEPFGMVVLEAISRGVPVIVPSVGGPAEVVRDGTTGWCFTPGNVQELVTKITECLVDPTRAATMAMSALAATRKRYTWSKAVSKIRAVCRMLSDQKHKQQHQECAL